MSEWLLKSWTRFPLIVGSHPPVSLSGLRHPAGRPRTNGTFARYKGGLGKTTLALNLAGVWAREGLPRLFGVIGLARDTLHREAPELARDADMIVIDSPPHVAAQSGRLVFELDEDTPAARAIAALAAAIDTLGIRSASS